MWIESEKWTQLLCARLSIFRGRWVGNNTSSYGSYRSLSYSQGTSRIHPSQAAFIKISTQQVFRHLPENLALATKSN